jgi:hypothetical protein
VNTPDPVQHSDPPSPPTGWKPTSSTYGSAAGGALATVVIGVLKSFGHEVDVLTASALVTLCAAGIGYYFPGGRV